MANFVLPVPSRLRTFPVFSSSNGASPSASGKGSVGGGGPVILELPLEKIKRPLMRTRANDPNKVKELMDSISEIGLQVPVWNFYELQELDVVGNFPNEILCFVAPYFALRSVLWRNLIDVLEVDGVYYGFSGCHRFEAHQRLGLSTIRCKVRRGTKETLRHHLR